MGRAPDDVEILRRAFEAWNAGDLERVVVMAHTDLEVVRLDPSSMVRPTEGLTGCGSSPPS